MKTPERKIIKSLNLTEISGVDRPAMEGARVAIIKSASPVAPAKPAYAPTPEGDAALSKMLAAIRGESINKAHHEEPHTMSNSTHFDQFVKGYADRKGITIAKAAERVMQDDDAKDAAADAYNRDEEDAVKRRYAEANRN